MEQNEQGKKWWLWIVVGIVIFLLMLLGFFLTIGKNSSVAKKISSVLPFGEVVPVTPGSTITGGGTITGGNEGTPGITGEEPMFKQLSKESVAGFTTISNGGKTLVRYVLRENGNVHEIDVKTGVDTQLTNTTIPRIYEAFFGNQGNTVILRYLRHDYTTDTIVTYLGDIQPATDGQTVGSLKKSTDVLPDNITAVSISPNGTNMLYLRTIPEGISATIVSLGAFLSPREVFRNSFREWAPQLFDNGTILLTTKPSALVPGFSYVYDNVKKTLTRIVREKNGLTTFGDPLGGRILFSENIAGNSLLGIYIEKGAASEEGTINHEAAVSLTTLPEKCAWGPIYRTLYCGSAPNSSRSQLPDDWYQGLISINDMFWKVNTDNTDVTFIADPKKAIEKNFDVTLPLVDSNEQYLFFVDKYDDSLWSMRLPPPSDADADFTASSSMPELTPEEQKDAAGTTLN